MFGADAAPEIIATWGRVIERVLIVIASITCMAFGWNLFKIGVVGEQIAEFSKAGFTAKLQKVGPGVFFALFGAAVMTSSVVSGGVRIDGLPRGGNTPQRSDQRPSSVSMRYLGSSADERRQIVASLNTPLRIVSKDTVKDLSGIELEELVAANNGIRIVRDHMMSQEFGGDALQVWREFGDRFLDNPTNVPAQHREILALMKPWMLSRVSVPEKGGTQQ